MGTLNEIINPDSVMPARNADTVSFALLKAIAGHPQICYRADKLATEQKCVNEYYTDPEFKEAIDTLTGQILKKFPL